ncbi:unnamed protein product [Ectocarpus fasciculatus]
MSSSFPGRATSSRVYSTSAPGGILRQTRRRVVRAVMLRQTSVDGRHTACRRLVCCLSHPVAVIDVLVAMPTDGRYETFPLKEVCRAEYWMIVWYVECISRVC